MPAPTESHRFYLDRDCSPQSSPVSFQTPPNSRNLHDYSELGKAIEVAVCSDDSHAAGHCCTPSFFLFARIRKLLRRPGASKSYTPLHSKGASTGSALDGRAPAIPAHAPKTITMFAESNRSPQISCTRVGLLAGHGDPDLSQDAVGPFL